MTRLNKTESAVFLYCRFSLFLKDQFFQIIYCNPYCVYLQDDFAMSLVDLFIEKMEERNELTAKLWTGKAASQSEIKVDNT